MRTTTMDLGLSLELGESSSKQLRLVQNAEKTKGLALCMGFEQQEGRRMEEKRASNELSLLPLAPVPRNQPAPHLGLPWQTENRGIDVNQLPSGGEEVEEGVAVSSPNSTLSSFQMDFSIHSGGGGGGTNGDSDQTLGFEMEPERTSSRASDDDENGSARKKLRLSKEQAVYLEESFKEHNTLNPKQKLALAKQLNLRARQVEVWFQNRRARTKLKQTEVDCEYLKRCCEKLTEENRRLQKEIQELRALKACNPFYMQLPPTTLTMCPSCERVATTTTNNTTGAKATGVSLTNPRFCDPFSQASAPPKSTAA